jgi:hypothetical protein
MLLCLVYVTTVAASGSEGAVAVTLVQLVTLWLAFSASESHTARRIAGVACIVVAILAVLALGFGKVFDYDTAAVRALSLVSVVLYLIAPYVILRHLVYRSVVDLRTVLGAVAVYLMLGMMFAFTYRALSLYQADPFFGDSGPGTNADFLFFSFITLTTTGYGNLVPAANPGQSIAVLEAIIGQLFLVTALAKIVNAYRLPGMARGDDPAPGGEPS